MKLERKSTLVFVGDSITCAQRDLGDYYGLGEGYVKYIGDELIDLELTIINRGYDGANLGEIYQYLEDHCSDVPVDLLSILGGVNDARSNPQKTLTQFTEDYRKMIQQAKKEKDLHIVLCEPFVLMERNENPNLYDTVFAYAKEVERIAHEFDGIHVPLFDYIQSLKDETGFAS